MTEEFRGYSGRAYSPAGDKGRFTLPTDFRKAVKLSSDGRQLCLTKHDRWTCLIGFGLSRQDEFEAELDREERRATDLGREFDRDLRAMQLNGFATLSFDDSGRFVMPDHLREQAGIEDGVYFQGAGRFFTLWEKSELDKMGPEFDAAKAACAALVAEAQAKAQAKGR